MDGLKTSPELELPFLVLKLVSWGDNRNIRTKVRHSDELKGSGGTVTGW